MTHRQLILIDDILGWPTLNVCPISVTTLSGEEQDRSLSVIGEQFLRPMWLYFFTVQFESQPRGIYEPANLGWGYQENITILTLTEFVV